MNRRDFQELARLRLQDAQALLKARRYSGAYYLSGYAVECALKACIAKKTKRHDFSPDRKFLDKIYTHELVKLINSAGLENELAGASNPLQTNWATVKDWNEHIRYEKIGRQKAQDMVDAIADESEGVLAWVRRFW